MNKSIIPILIQEPLYIRKLSDDIEQIPRRLNKKESPKGFRNIIRAIYEVKCNYCGKSKNIKITRNSPSGKTRAALKESYNLQKPYICYCNQSCNNKNRKFIIKCIDCKDFIICNNKNDNKNVYYNNKCMTIFNASKIMILATKNHNEKLHNFNIEGICKECGKEVGLNEYNICKECQYKGFNKKWVFNEIGECSICNIKLNINIFHQCKECLSKLTGIYTLTDEETLELKEKCKNIQNNAFVIPKIQDYINKIILFSKEKNIDIIPSVYSCGRTNDSNKFSENIGSRQLFIKDFKDIGYFLFLKLTKNNIISVIGMSGGYKVNQNGPENLFIPGSLTSELLIKCNEKPNKEYVILIKTKCKSKEECSILENDIGEMLLKKFLIINKYSHRF